MLVDRTTDRELLQSMARMRRDIRMSPICEPGSGEYVDTCAWSRTGYAVHKSPGHCTCNPANEPDAAMLQEAERRKEQALARFKASR